MIAQTRGTEIFLKRKLVGFGLLKLIYADVATLFSRLIEALHLNADSRIIHALVKVGALQP